MVDIFVSAFGGFRKGFIAVRRSMMLSLQLGCSAFRCEFKSCECVCWGRGGGGIWLFSLCGCLEQLEGILYAHASIWSFKVPQRQLYDVYWELRSTNVFFKLSRYFSDESEFIVASLSLLRGQSFLSQNSTSKTRRRLNVVMLCCYECCYVTKKREFGESRSST